MSFTADEESELFASLLAEEGMVVESADVIPHCDRSQDIPASYGQQSLWLLDQMQPGSAAYNLPMAYRLRGPLRLEALAASLEALVERHEVLRTALEMVNGQLVQRIAPYRQREKHVVSVDAANALDATLAMPLVIDLQSLPLEQRSDEAQRRRVSEIRRPFDLQKGPLFRALVLRLDPEDHFLVLTMHHCISDEWSLGILRRALSAGYEGALGGHEMEPALALFQYADYAKWERERLERSENADALRAYWRQTLAAPLPVLSLPTDFPRPTAQTSQGAHVSFTVDRLCIERLVASARQENATMFMILLAAFLVLLRRYCGQDDLIIGTPVANRQRPEFADALGFFANTVVLRTDVSGNPSFAELVRRVKLVVLDAHDHQDLPFEQLVELVNPNRNANTSPLFNVMFTYTPAMREEFVLRNLEVKTVSLELGSSKFDFSLDLWEGATDLEGLVEYDAEIFDAATVQRMVEHFCEIVRDASRHFDKPILELSLLSPIERRQILTEWNRTDRNHQPVPAIHHLFERWAKMTPEATAIVCGERRVSYRELDARADDLAQNLRSLGIGPEEFVCIYSDRTPEAVIALLAVLKAGGAYVPIDASQPPERVNAILHATRAMLVLGESTLLEALPLDNGVRRLAIDGAEAEPAGFAGNTDTKIHADNAAYAIATSGSTGHPKVVVVSHANLVNAFFGWEEAFELSRLQSHLQMASFSFDVFTGDWTRALCSGAKLVLCPRESLLAPGELHTLMVREDVDCAEFVPAILRELVQHLERSPGSLASMRLLISGSDTWYVDELPRIRRLLGPSTRLLNTFGITECTIDSSFYDTDGCSASRSGIVPIGQPFGNTRMYVLNELLEPVPVGVIGELHIGGLVVGRGYARDPRQTAVRFIPDPFDSTPGRRLYRTGDRARYLSEGRFEFLGRMDHQAKVRGCRVEFGEIETALAQIPNVREVVVVNRQISQRETTLVAYLVATAPAPSAANLRESLRRTLPEYMVPSYFIFIDRMPLTANGKRNLKALPEFEPGRDEDDSGRAARTPLEQSMTRLLGEVLGTTVGIDDDFFALGGHSLKAVQFLARLEEIAHVRLPVRALFSHPTMAQLARFLESKQSDRSMTSEPKVEMKRQAMESSFLQVERRPLLGLITSGKIPPVDAVALSYLPDYLSWAFVDHGHLTLDDFIEQWYGDLPMLMQIQETPIGRIGDVVLPLDFARLYRNPSKTLEHIIDAMRLARHIGARTVSLTGLIPSATNYGLALRERLRDLDEPFPQPTTGHSVTTAAMVLSVQRALLECGRDMSRERVAFLGLGSIGTSTLRLMLRCLPHPAEIMLCDLQTKRDSLNSLAEELVRNHGFRGRITILESHDEAPPEFYSATLMIGATNVSDVLSVHRLQAGTIVVDDSVPHCFSSEQALERWHIQSDVLLVDGGALRSPAPIRRLRHVPLLAERQMTPDQRALLTINESSTIMGCVSSSALTARFPTLPPTLGLVDLDSSLLHYDQLRNLQFTGADLHLEEYFFNSDDVARFRERFGQLKCNEDER